MQYSVLRSSKKGITISGGSYLDYIKTTEEESVISSGRTTEKIFFYVTYS